MGIARRKAIAVVDLNHQTITRPWSSPGHNATCDATNLCARLASGQIYTAVKTALAGNRVWASAERGCDPRILYRAPGDKAVFDSTLID